MRLRDEGLPLPAAGVALSPWTDLALTGDSIRDNSRRDLTINAARAASFARHYLAGTDPRHAYASPLYGDHAGLPPVLIQVGGDEILRDDSVRIAEKLRAAGSSAQVELWSRMPHVWHLYARVLPEARRAIERVGAFVQQETARAA
jgi:acetyl esterase/lipase